MSALHVLLPPRDRYASATDLREWLARGTRLRDAEPGYVAALREHFSWPDGPLPVAALIRQLVAGDAGDALWLCADPAWVQPELNGARLLACGNLGLRPDDAATLVAALAETFSAEGMELRVGDAEHWQLKVPRYVDLPHFPEPEEALGADLFEQLPQGTDGRRWRALINEAQVVLHNEPWNATRRAQGVAPVNSVWLWGGGTLPDWVESGLGRVVSDDLLVWALAARAGVDVVGRDPRSAATDDAAFTLLDLQDTQLSSFERDWWPVIATRLQAGGSEVRLSFASGERYILRAAHRLRFWRRTPKA
ncbi:hypothetical protein EC912_101292 [Luteibacter rhizovicinus]|uniref:Phosphoglycerate mutase n=1 Tax=Luteibacter rhizovicinus TaxID=242606 RepID=A0A4R3YXL9_9GAMM|nr:phosphoglycerate mutase [Luteibacter rhizovicinus]TCV97292.1 hypothetical protein EC912_101292 [Luteibacter rhizovicinus]